MNTDKVALVTGATSGIGRATAIGLAAAGYRVVVCGRRAGLIGETAAACGAQDGRAIGQPCDVTDERSVAGLFARAVEAFGRVDVVFNNAGRSSPSARIDEMEAEDFRATVAVNLTGVFLVAREAFRVMKAQSPQGGRIINNGSISAYVPRPNAAGYNASKHGVTGLTKTVSLEGRAFNIACGQIDIGNAATDMTRKMQTGMLQADGSVRPEPRMDVRHVVDAVVYMAGLPLEANVQFMTVMATDMPYIGRG
jgi:NAD(P)-dependent dehydrogenase (short-subunit alcohol dehydrogenase family)